MLKFIKRLFNQNRMYIAPYDEKISDDFKIAVLTLNKYSKYDYYSERFVAE